MRYIIFVLGLIIISSCSLTNPQNNDNLIREQLSSFERSFNYKDINGMLNLVQPGYLHGGMGIWQFSQFWQDRMASYALLEIRAVEVVAQGDYATVSMSLDFIDPSGNMSYEEPESSGDISYFYFNGAEWKICGRDYHPWGLNETR